MKTIKLRLILLTLVIFASINYNAISQVGIGVEPEASAMLDVSSTDKGLLAPRMTTAQKNAISSPADGLLVFDTDDNVFCFFDGVSWVRLINENSTSDYTGWADYVDGTYTSGSPFTLVANTKVTLPNDASTTRDSQKPIDITEFYDSANSKITGRDGDGLNVMIEFKVKPTANKTTKITVAIDIGGAVGEIYTRDFITSKGVGIEHFYLSSFNTYTLDTWETNGGTVKIESDYSAEIYDIRYVLTRTHKGR
ncbi:hypothetical protein [Psychroserpens ponticola]|uniref:Uncharacterized protein n=1 Tax=Psychroserpens ponticola TaxID=2932268 RepID=A0ABY7S4S2_9FLAO|nr:hypothetical protein [Psychroserpens ponticola]WCO03406.1 hypothetical protein MUN68_007840 [Psychroserpens ponticola]